MAIFSSELARRASLALVAAGGLFLAGCAGTPEIESEIIRGARFAPQPPPFLAGAMAGLLTNTPGFTARVYLTAWPDEAAKPLTGDLFVRGTQLFFAPDPGAEKKKKDDLPDAGFSFLWNAAENRGHLLSETLQGQAPVSSNVRYTLTPVAGQETNRIREFTVVYENGPTNRLRVWVSSAGVPERIQAVTGQIQSPELGLTRIRFQLPPQELFQVPPGFTAFTSPEGMMDEIAMRQRQLKKRDPALDMPLDPMGGPP